MYFDSNVNRDGTRKGKVAKTVVRIKFKHKSGNQRGECFVFVNFHLHYTEPDSPMGAYLKVGGLLFRKQLEGGGLFEGAY